MHCGNLGIVGLMLLHVRGYDKLCCLCWRWEVCDMCTKVGWVWTVNASYFVSSKILRDL